MKGFEWAASLMVFGSRVIDSRGGPWPYFLYAIGVVLLTLGVRLSIDVAKADR